MIIYFIEELGINDLPKDVRIYFLMYSLRNEDA